MKSIFLLSWMLFHLSHWLQFKQSYGAFLLSNSGHMNTSSVKCSCPAYSVCSKEFCQMFVCVPDSMWGLPSESWALLGRAFIYCESPCASCRKQLQWTLVDHLTGYTFLQIVNKKLVDCCILNRMLFPNCVKLHTHTVLCQYHLMVLIHIHTFYSYR